MNAFGAVELPPETWQASPFTWLGTAVDSAAVRAMQIVVDRVLMPSPDQVASLRRSAEPFLAGALLDDPQSFLAMAELAEPSLPATTKFRRSLPGGAVLRSKVHTQIAPEDPILVEHWSHESSRPSAVVIALHGFTMGYVRMDAPALMAMEWYRRGLDVALVALPFHGPRTPSTARFSGDRFACADVSELNAAANRAIHEIRLVIRWLRREVGVPVGLLGLSLGGYLAATVAGLEDDLAFVVPMVPPACFGDLAWRFFSSSRTAREIDNATLSYEELRTAYRVHSPLTYPLRIPRERVMIVAGRGDRIVPPEHPHALWRHWGEPELHWFSGSHLAPFGRRGIVEQVSAHLERIGILAR